MFCVSPDRPTNRVIYWVGAYAGCRFDLARAHGPHTLDGGDVAYAPNILRESGCGAGGQGRALLFAWLQERDAARVRAHAADHPAKAPPASATGRTQFGGVAYASVADAAAALEVAAHEGYAGCLSVPRVLSLSLDGRRVVQAPAAELARLRGASLGALRRGTRLRDGVPEPLIASASADAACCDVLARFARGSAAAVGLWRPPGAPGGAGLLLTFCFASGALEATHECSLDAAAAAAAAAHSQHACFAAGAAAQQHAAYPPSSSASSDGADGADGTDDGTDGTADEASYDEEDLSTCVELRVLFDHSAVEVFTTERGAAPGLALATRHYAGAAGRGSGGVCLVALGGEGAVRSAAAWAMGTIWEGGGDKMMPPEECPLLFAAAEAARRRAARGEPGGEGGA
jgi:hypothetical protein